MFVLYADSCSLAFQQSQDSAVALKAIADGNVSCSPPLPSSLSSSHWTALHGLSGSSSLSSSLLFFSCSSVLLLFLCFLHCVHYQSLPQFISAQVEALLLCSFCNCSLSDIKDCHNRDSFALLGYSVVFFSVVSSSGCVRALKLTIVLSLFTLEFFAQAQSLRGPSYKGVGQKPRHICKFWIRHKQDPSSHPSGSTFSWVPFPRACCFYQN